MHHVFSSTEWVWHTNMNRISYLFMSSTEKEVYSHKCVTTVKMLRSTQTLIWISDPDPCGLAWDSTQHAVNNVRSGSSQLRSTLNPDPGHRLERPMWRTINISVTIKKARNIRGFYSFFVLMRHITLCGLCLFLFCFVFLLCVFDWSRTYACTVLYKAQNWNSLMDLNWRMNHQ